MLPRIRITMDQLDIDNCVKKFIRLRRGEAIRKPALYRRMETADVVYVLWLMLKTVLKNKLVMKELDWYMDRRKDIFFICSHISLDLLGGPFITRDRLVKARHYHHMYLYICVTGLDHIYVFLFINI